MRLILVLIRLILTILGALLAPLVGLAERLLYGAEKPGAFRDHRRRRSIPYKLYEPKGVDGPAPVVLFSHGMGGTCEAAPYLGQALAAAGYWGVFLQHPGSDRDSLGALRGAGSQDEARQMLRRTALDPEARRDRFLDAPFVLDRLAELNAEPGGRFEGRFDLSRVGMGGHSYGARTVMAAAGQRLPGTGQGFDDPRIRAGLLLSPSGTRLPGQADTQHGARDYDAVRIPLLHVTGTRDSDPQLRILPYKSIRAPGQYLLLLDGATHGDFSAAAQRSELQDPPGPERDRVTNAVALAAVLFFDAYLKGSEAALTALREEFPSQLKSADRFEFK